MGERSPALFDSNGNAGPTVWCDGRVVGGWTQLPSGAVAYRLLENVGAQAKSALDKAAHRLENWLGAVRLAARTRRRFMIEKELLG